MKKIIKGFVVFIVILAFALVTMFMISTDYYLVRPGSIEPLSELIVVEGSENISDGEFYLTTVNQTRANALVWLYGYFNPYVELVEREDVLPEDMEVDDYREMMNQYMEDSKNMSKVIALKRIGYDIEVKSDGIKVMEVPETSPANGILQEGDLITKVDGEEIPIAEEMVEKVKDRQIGDTVNLLFEREGEIYEKDIKTVESPNSPGSAALEIFVKTSGWTPVFPIDIEIDSGDIGGPSAGLMFALEIKNQLTDYDLTAGKKIAGTGTINMDEEVGSVGGVRHKMVAAESEGVRYFFAPKANEWIAHYVEEFYDDFDAVIVEDLDDALDFLEELREKK
ncbi:PDZ domain-containing protein [Natranaerofaba carboxydovora]|uniref:YlbL family protein n=1 Tax=Natranaerofaba carboxydovora TaxID=2742683 RepID=UPI001F12D61A|nr:PDZ domain-containing protein [Natranaerofaba carboxydovora]UMZ73316.1 PDZ domain protein [Natranaerofaba carboxydovora]